MDRLACINIDLDGLAHYAAIHALGPHALPPGARDLVDRVAIDRFLELCDACGVTATLFAIGRDLGEAGSRNLRRAADAGFEVGNHTHAHDYAFASRSLADISADLQRGASDIARACGVRPRGFRAPGYTVSATVYRALCEQDYAYGSSVFPAAPYYLAKAAVLALQRARGKRSTSALDRPQVLAAPLLPYRPDPAEPYRRGSGPVVELPISVEPRTRFPFIGTFAATLPPPVVEVLYRQVSKQPFLNLELHGADLLDESDGTGPQLARAQRDLRVSATTKVTRLAALIRRIAADYPVVTLLQASTQVA